MSIHHPRGILKQAVATEKEKNGQCAPTIKSKLFNKKHVYNIQSSKMRDAKFMGRNMGTGKVEKEMVKELKKMPEEKASKGSNITNLLLDSK